MPGRARRYEIYLPRSYNPDEEGFRRRVERDKFTLARRRLLNRFGGMTTSTRRPYQGLWQDDSGTVFADEIEIFVTLDLSEDWYPGETFFREFKEELKASFEQLEILLYFQDVYRL